MLQTGEGFCQKTRCIGQQRGLPGQRLEGVRVLFDHRLDPGIWICSEAAAECPVSISHDKGIAKTVVGKVNANGRCFEIDIAAINAAQDRCRSG